MTTEHQHPPFRDLPAGRLRLRKQHLLLELARGGEDRRPFSFKHSAIPRLRSRRAAIVVTALTAALTLPALALSGELGALFGFSNQGTSVNEANVGLRAASALETTGASGTLKQLAARGGVGIYVSRDASGDLCYFVGPPSGHLDRGLSGGCLNAAASREFPSPEQPVINMSAFVYRPGTVGEGISRLVGVAADGVAKIQVLGLDCQVIAEAPVIDNVYARTGIPTTPAVAIVGLDQGGQRVYVDKLRFWDKSACSTSGTS
jgi:hypothetical protein